MAWEITNSGREADRPQHLGLLIWIEPLFATLAEHVRARNLRIESCHERVEFLVHLTDAHVLPIRPVGDHFVPKGLPAVCFGELGAPAELVIDLACLYPLELREQLQAQRTGVLLTVGDICDSLIALGAVEGQPGMGLDRGGPRLGV